MTLFPFSSKDEPGPDPEKHDHYGDNYGEFRVSPASSAAYSGSGSDVPDSIQAVRFDIRASFLHDTQAERKWFHAKPGEGVYIKKSRGVYACAPPSVASDGSGLYEAIVGLNVRCAMTITSSPIKALVGATKASHVQIGSGKRLQIVSGFDTLPQCQRNQAAAFIAPDNMLLVWGDDQAAVLERAEDILDDIKTMFGEYGLVYTSDSTFSTGSGKGSVITSSASSGRYEPEVTIAEEEPRRQQLFQCTYTSLAIILLIAAVGTGFRQIAVQQVQDPNWLRLIFLIALPAQIWLSLFFFQAVVGNLAQIFGAPSLLKKNSRYYSGKAPLRLRSDGQAQLPHVTVQMPVYREGLQAVIKPTIQSVKRAIATYELQGGTANILINDDGMQLVPFEDAMERREFYDENDIGWVARPRHNPQPMDPSDTPFLRRGKFKKASNMNYALRLSVEVEDRLANVARHQEWNQIDENNAYREILQHCLDEREGEALADGSIRIGDYILLIDCDTRVPRDCLLEAVSEMEQSPEVAILQYSSGVMNVTNNFFENGITFFTNMIYSMIRFAVANGDVAPFVGHNAILRWTALQKVSYQCELDDMEKFWSESTVSEDFDMSLRLQSAGYIIRLGAYHGDGFKEGVSLTVYDELNRWEKYAYGCSELIFHPIRDWPSNGPFTRLFMQFITSNMPLASKITIMAYIGTYYAIGSAWILTILNYFLIGFFNGHLDHYYLDSFHVYFAIVFVFTFVGNIALGVVRYRSGEAGLTNFIVNLKWIPLLSIFLGGLSLHVSQALICHFLSIDMQWGSTSKEVEDISFVNALRAVWRKFKWTFAFCFTMTTVMLVCRFAIQEDWQIKTLIACWPMGTVVVGHFLLPLVLNPQLMTFFW